MRCECRTGFSPSHRGQLPCAPCRDRPRRADPLCGEIAEGTAERRDDRVDEEEAGYDVNVGRASARPTEGSCRVPPVGTGLEEPIRYAERLPKEQRSDATIASMKKKLDTM